MDHPAEQTFKEPTNNKTRAGLGKFLRMLVSDYVGDDVGVMLVSDLRNLRKYLVSPSTRLADPRLRKQRKSDTHSRILTHSAFTHFRISTHFLTRISHFTHFEVIHYGRRWRR